MSLVYSEKHEQAKWVTHIITPDVAVGTQGRSNDFRVDPMVTTGSAQEQDYFLKKRIGGKTKYDGFGYDRGHLVENPDSSGHPVPTFPTSLSATKSRRSGRDLQRWSKKALSESYFYSNMSPQLPGFNRESWADLEGFIRAYVANNKTQVYVVTGPVLIPGLEKIQRGVNKVSIPKQFFKCVYDPANKRGIAFLMDNAQNSLPSLEYATSIDKIAYSPARRGSPYWYQLFPPTGR